MGTRITQKGTSFKGATKLYFLHYSHVMRVPKRPFVFLQQNTKFYSCTRTATCYYTAKYETLQLHSKGHLFCLNVKKVKNVISRYSVSFVLQ